MSIMSQAKLRLSLLLTTGLIAGFASGESRAYTMEQQQACMPDAFRVCGSEIPDVERITACMVRNKSQLSPQCRAYFRPSADEGDSPRLRPAAAERARMHRIRRPRPDDT